MIFPLVVVSLSCLLLLLFFFSIVSSSGLDASFLSRICRIFDRASFYERFDHIISARNDISIFPISENTSL